MCHSKDRLNYKKPIQRFPPKRFFDTDKKGDSYLKNLLSSVSEKIIDETWSGSKKNGCIAYEIRMNKMRRTDTPSHTCSTAAHAHSYTVAQLHTHTVTHVHSCTVTHAHSYMRTVTHILSQSQKSSAARFSRARGRKGCCRPSVFIIG